MHEEADLRERITEEFMRRCFAAQEAMAFKLLLNGLISRGYTVGYRTWAEGTTLHHECWPVAPPEAILARADD